MSTRRASSSATRQSIEAKQEEGVVDVEMKDNIDAEGVDEAEGEISLDDNPDLYSTIHDVSTYLCSVEEDGEELAGGFQRIPNRRTLPDYFDIISEPVAFSTIRSKIQRKQYTNFAEFVRDVALICHNAQVYNRPSAPIFGAAEKLRDIFKGRLVKLVAKGIVTEEQAKIPDFGELPEAEDSPPPGSDANQAEEEDDNDDDDDDDDDDEESDEDGTRKRRRQKGRGSARRGAGGEDDRDDDGTKRRGRPPSVLTPTEARISTILRGLRKPKDEDGNLLIVPFEKLPDKNTLPDYYTALENPIALDNIKKKAKRKKYRDVNSVMMDIEQMFSNAKMYNEDNSPLYRAAERLLKHAQSLAEQEKAKPDDSFRDEDGKLALAEIHHNSQVWTVGDWVHIRNPNDLAKPIVAQIYRTWQDRAGQKWINACWYYRPEQTVHRYEKHFYEREVVKTGQYRDHQIEDALDHCFVMFITRFPKGRPRGFPRDKDVYLCESRYNEDRARFNKIKTWASCVPDEIRERDYEMELFDAPQRMRKLPSPIKHLLREDAKETDDLPKPTWGSPNAPPIVGAVHRRPPEANESPPPEPAWSPAPQPSILPAHSAQSKDAPRRNPPSMTTPRNLTTETSGRGPALPFTNDHISSPSPAPYNPHTGSQFQPITQGAMHVGQATLQTPVPIPQHHQTVASPQQSIQQLQYQQQQQQQHRFPPHYQQNFTQPPAVALHHQQSTANQMASSFSQVPLPQTNRLQYNPTPGQSAHHNNAYNPPRPPEVYTLGDNINDNLPRSLRQSFQTDSDGRVLFFTVPPLDRPHKGIAPESSALGHSAEYLAGRQEWLADRERKRKERDEQKRDEASKRAAVDVADARQSTNTMFLEATGALGKWFQAMDEDTERWVDDVGVREWREQAALRTRTA